MQYINTFFCLQEISRTWVLFPTFNILYLCCFNSKQEVATEKEIYHFELGVKDHDHTVICLWYLSWHFYKTCTRLECKYNVTIVVCYSHSYSSYSSLLHQHCQSLRKINYCNLVFWCLVTCITISQLGYTLIHQEPISVISGYRRKILLYLAYSTQPKYLYLRQLNRLVVSSFVPPAL